MKFKLYMCQRMIQVSILIDFQKTESLKANRFSSCKNFPKGFLSELY